MGFLACKTCLHCSVDDSHTQGLGENENVAGPAAMVGPYLVLNGEAGDPEAVLGRRVADRMPACYHSPALGDFALTAKENLFENRKVEAGGKTDQVQGNLRLPSHGIDVT
ncbi:hypothetical protein SDC9_184413 [bioreactor metagenome]|uniref:Uncharacterized protein n=1 Tax=bioreactor metagenome TaxID=1076179 RepID=A0A645HCZ9_9ZZZZ